MKQIEVDKTYLASFFDPSENTGPAIAYLKRIISEHEMCNCGQCQPWLRELSLWWDWSWIATQEDPKRKRETLINGQKQFVPVKYSGGLTGRLSKFLMENTTIKMTAAEISELGNCLRLHGFTKEAKGADVTVKFTHDLDWVRGDFGDPNSCFWSERHDCRDLLIETGAMAMQFFSLSGLGIGRCWVVEPVPYPQHYAIFNGYWRSGSPCPRLDNPLAWMASIFAGILGTDFKRVGMLNYHSDYRTMYINGAAGYILPSVESDVVDLEIGDLVCARCGCLGASRFFGDEMYCDECYHYYAEEEDEPY